MLLPRNNKFVIGTPIEKAYEGKLVLMEEKDPVPHIEAEIISVHSQDKDLEVGQKVLFVRLSGNYFMVGEKEYVVIPKDQIIGKIE